MPSSNCACVQCDKEPWAKAAITPNSSVRSQGSVGTTSQLSLDGGPLERSGIDVERWVQVGLWFCVPSRQVESRWDLLVHAPDFHMWGEKKKQKGKKGKDDHFSVQQQQQQQTKKSRITTTTQPQHETGTIRCCSNPVMAQPRRRPETRQMLSLSAGNNAVPRTLAFIPTMLPPISCSVRISSRMGSTTFCC